MGFRRERETQAGEREPTGYEPLERERGRWAYAWFLGSAVKGGGSAVWGFVCAVEYLPVRLYRGASLIQIKKPETTLSTQA